MCHVVQAVNLAVREEAASSEHLAARSGTPDSTGSSRIAFKVIHVLRVFGCSIKEKLNQSSCYYPFYGMTIILKSLKQLESID